MRARDRAPVADLFAVETFERITHRDLARAHELGRLRFCHLDVYLQGRLGAVAFDAPE